jgi:TPP-dependent pyruvate/acetoin dehydrogenase alpha subunit
MTDDLAQLRRMILIRRFETALMARADHGFQLLSSGQEAVAVGLCAALGPDDQLLASGRSIGPALARGLDPAAVMAELLGRTTGPCGGRGGRGHLSQPQAGFFGAHAVVGGNLTIAAGVALQRLVEGAPGLAACIFGDGACGSGALHETMNIAALWGLPLLLVCDNNQYSVSTPRAEGLAPARLSDLAVPFAMPHVTVDGMDLVAVRDAARGFAEHIRAGGGPCFLECLSQRFSSHSSSTRDTRSPTELAAVHTLCPIEAFAAQLRADGRLDSAARTALEAEVDIEVAAALIAAEQAPLPDPADVLAYA